MHSVCYSSDVLLQWRLVYIKAGSYEYLGGLFKHVCVFRKLSDDIDVFVK